MILRIYCKYCSKSNKINSYASDRVELAKEKGSPLIFTCKHCLKTQERSLNDVFAENGILNLIFLIGMILGTIIIANFLLKYLDKGGIYSLFILPIGIAIPSLIYFVWLIEEKKKIRSFNKFRK